MITIIFRLNTLVSAPYLILLSAKVTTVDQGRNTMSINACDFHISDPFENFRIHKTGFYW